MSDRSLTSRPRFLRKLMRNKRHQPRRKANNRKLQTEQLENRLLLTHSIGTVSGPYTVPNGGETVISGNISSLSGFGSINLYPVSLVQGDVITADIDAKFNDSGASTGNGLDSYLRLFNSSGTEIARDDDSGPGLDALIYRQSIASTGTYYVGVSAYPNSAYSITNDSEPTSSGSSTGSYRLELRRNRHENPSVSASPTTNQTIFDDQNAALTWSAADTLDAQLGSVSAVLRRGSTVVGTSSNSSGSHSVNPSSNGLGTYQLQVTATAIRPGANPSTTVSSQTVTVVDDDTSGPVISLGGSSGVQSHAQNQLFSWSISDTSGISSSNTTITRNGIPLPVPSPSATVESFNLDPYGPGTFVISVTATDNDTDRGVADRSSSSASRTVTVTNATPIAAAGPDKSADEGDALVFNGGASSDADGDALSYHWNFGDGNTATGVAPSHAYADNGLYHVILTVTDPLGASSSDTLSVTVNNAAPELQNVSISSPIDENDTATLSGDIVDPGTADAFTLTVDWGDGTVETFDYAPGTTSFSETHQYLDDDPTATPSDTYNVSATLTDNDMAAGGGALRPNLMLSGSSSRDVSTFIPDGVSLNVVSGSTPDTNTQALLVTRSGASALNAATLQAYLDSGGIVITEYNITDEVFNLAFDEQVQQPVSRDGNCHDHVNPVEQLNLADPFWEALAHIDPQPSGQAGCGFSVHSYSDITPLGGWGNETVQIAYRDRGEGRLWLVEADWQDGESGVNIGAFDASEAILGYMITHGRSSLASATFTTTVTVNNVPPVVASVNLSQNTIDENGNVTVSGSVTDVGSLDTHTVDIDFGDGSAPVTIAVDPLARTYSASHQYLDDNPTGTPSDQYTISVTATDDDGGVSPTATAVITVNNVAPTVDDLAVTSSISESGSAVLTGTIVDPGTLDTFTLDVDWGDGSAVQSVTLGNGAISSGGVLWDPATREFSVNHQYLDDDPSGTPSDVYSLTVSLTDDDGGVAGTGGIGGNIYLTGHDVLLHSGQNYYDAVILDFLRGVGTSSEIAKADYDIAIVGSGVGFANFTGGSGFTWFGSGSGVPLTGALSGYGSATYFQTGTGLDWSHILSHDALVILSHTSCGGCDLSTTGSNEINVQSADIATAVNAGMDLWGLSGASLPTYYDFLPPGAVASGTPIGASSGFTATTEGMALGIQNNMINGYPTHNRFASFDPVFTVYETRGSEIISLGLQSAVISGGGIGTGLSVTVHNVAPSLNPLSLTATSIDENGSVTLDATFTDPGTLDEHTVTIDWGDGTSDLLTLPVGDRSFSLSHQYLDDDPTATPSDSYTISVTLSDDDTGSDSGSTSIQVDNVAPTVSAGADETIDEGTAFVGVGSFSDPGTMDTWTATVDYGDGSGLQSLALNPDKSFSLDHFYGDNDTYTVSVTVTDDDGGTTTDTLSVTVLNVAPDVSVDTPIQTVQYSDTIANVTFTATDVPTDVMNAAVSYSTDNGATFTPGLPDAASISAGVAFAGDANQVATGTWTVSGIADLAPGTYIFRVAVSDEDGGTGTADATVVVEQENADATYDGPLFVSTDPQNPNDGVVPLRAVIRDVTAFDPSADAEAGYVTTATVSFINRDTGAVIASGVPVSLLGLDSKVGIATYDWDVSLQPNATAATFDIGVEIDGFYTGVADDLLITVARPNGDFITGGGYLVNDASVGAYAGGDGLKTNFGFNVKFNKKLTNLMGHFNAIVRQDDGTILKIKSNATDSLVVDPTVGVDGHATFVSKANLTDVTDPANPVGIAGNLQLIVKVTDNGEPGAGADTISFALWNGATLLFSSNFDGTKTVEQTITGGDTQIHTDADPLAAAGSTSTSDGSLLLSDQDADRKNAAGGDKTLKESQLDEAIALLVEETDEEEQDSAIDAIFAELGDDLMATL